MTVTTRIVKTSDLDGYLLLLSLGGYTTSLQWRTPTFENNQYIVWDVNKNEQKSINGVLLWSTRTSVLEALASIGYSQKETLYDSGDSDELPDAWDSGFETNLFWGGSIRLGIRPRFGRRGGGRLSFCRFCE